MVRSKGGVWSRARELAAATPPERNRYVDFLRAASILVVVFGHFLMAAPYLDAGSPQIAHMLDVASWTHWLTWLLQVMPVFFFVGGYANGVSWDAALRDRLGYGAWLSSRVARLFGPVVPLVVAWAVIAAIAHRQGVHPEMIRVGSRVALVPTWFLAVYVLVVLLVPVTRRAWHRFGMASIAVPVAAAVLIDVSYFAGWKGVGWLNYLFVWTAVHQLGFAWRDGQLAGLRRAIALATAGFAALVLLTELGPYPRSLVGVPGEAISNTLPPKLPLLALAAFQIGLLLSVERPLRRRLDGLHLWTATVVVNGTIMSIFLWHSTVMMLIVGLAFWAGGLGLEATPGSATWWALRLPWLAVFTVGTLAAVALFARFERPRRPGRGPASSVAAVAGSVVTCSGLAWLALHGVGGSGPFGIAVAPLLAVLAGTLLARASPLPTSGRR